MLKSGYYALYQGKEYHVESDINTRKTYIYTDDINLINETFIKGSVNGKWYEKSVQPYELDDVYCIRTFAYVDEKKRLVAIKETEDMYLVGTGSKNMDLVKKYNLQEIDRGIFEGWVSKDGVCLVEEREDMTRQFGVIKKSKNGK